eukprot:364100-Chlamydomonas_euryale.AAC.52
MACPRGSRHILGSHGPLGTADDVPGLTQADPHQCWRTSHGTAHGTRDLAGSHSGGALQNLPAFL